MISFATEAAARLASLRPSPQEVLQGEQLLGVYGRPVDSLARFCREWSLDRAVVDGMKDKGAYSSVPTFPRWLRERLENPYLVPLSRLVVARRRYGVDMALDGLVLRWPQEVAWASLCRLIGDPLGICLAHAWLKSARVDPGKGYMGLLRALSDASDAAYLSSHQRAMPPARILSLHTMPDDFVPTWRRMADMDYAKDIRRQGEVRVTALAARIQETAVREERQRLGMEAGARLEVERPHMRISLLSAAAEIGMVSDETLAAFHGLLEATRTGNVHGLAHHALAQSLSRYLATAPALSDEERAARMHVVSSLGPSWLKGIPSDWATMMDGKGASPSTAGVWASEIEGGRRRPPLDPLLDYGLWLAERRV